MVKRYPGDGATTNGFGRRWLQEWEARLLYEAGYPAPDMRVPGDWRLNAGGVPVPLVPQGADFLAEIQAVRAGLTKEERNEPRYHPDNPASWIVYFDQRHARELAAFDSPQSAPARKNADVRRLWWGAPGWTLTAVLDHIKDGNHPRLTMPPRPPAVSRRRGSSCPEADVYSTGKTA